MRHGPAQTGSIAAGPYAFVMPGLVNGHLHLPGNRPAAGRPPPPPPPAIAGRMDGSRNYMQGDCNRRGLPLFCLFFERFFYRPGGHIHQTQT